MNWGHAKIIIIIILVFLNLFLIFHLVKIEREKEYLSQDMIENASAVLSRMGITISPDAIPNRYYHLPIIHFQNPDDMDKKLANKLLGADLHIINSSNKGETIYQSDDKSLIFDQNHNFEYRLNDYKNYEISSTEDAVNQHLVNDMLITLGLSKKDFIFLNQWTSKGFTYTKIQQCLDGIALYGYEINISVTGGAIMEVTGRIILGNSTAESSMDTKDAVNVLFAMAENGGEQYGEILSMEIGYIAGDDIKQNIISLFPAWKIVTVANNTYYYDTVTGNIQQSYEVETQ